MQILKDFGGAIIGYAHDDCEVDVDNDEYTMEQITDRSEAELCFFCGEDIAN